MLQCLWRLNSTIGDKKNKRNHMQEHECDGNCAAANVLRRTIQGIFATILHNKKPRLAMEEVIGMADVSTMDLSTTIWASTKSPAKKNESLEMNKKVSMLMSKMSKSAMTTKPTRMAETTLIVPKTGYKMPHIKGRCAIVESVLGRITEEVVERQQILPVLGVTQTYVSELPIQPVAEAKTLPSEDPQGSATMPNYLPEVLDSMEDRDTLLHYLGSPNGYKKSIHWPDNRNLLVLSTGIT